MEKITQDQNEKSRYFEVVQILKNRIKEMAETQKKLKQKGGSWDRSQLMQNRYRITALLNFYLEFRGKVYRHAEKNLEYQNCWIYQNAAAKLREEFTVIG